MGPWRELRNRVLHLAGMARRNDRRQAELQVDRAEGAASAAPAEAAENDVIGLGHPEFRKKLEIALRGQQRAIVGNLHVIGLERVRRHFEGRWHRLAFRIHEIIRDVIQSKLSERDMFTRVNDDAYVIIFPGIDEHMAALKCALIASEIAHKIFGEQTSQHLVQSATAIVDASGQVEIAPHHVAELVRHLEVLGHASRTQVGEQPDLQAAPAPEDPSRGTDEEAKDEGSEWEDLNLRAYPSPGNRDQWVAIHRASDMQPEWIEVAKTPSDLHANLSVVFRPIWRPETSFTSGSLCLPARLDDAGGLLVGGAAMLTRVASSNNADLDAFLLERMARSIDGGRHGAVVIPVHFSTIAYRRERDKYLQLHGRLLQGGRDQSVFEIIGVTDSTPQMQLSEVLTALRAYCQSVHLRVRLDCRLIDRLLGENVGAVGVDVANVPMKEPVLADALRKFSREASAFGFACFVHGINSRSMALEALTCGFSFLDGDTLLPPEPLPSPDRAFVTRDMYSPLLAAYRDGT